MRVLITWIGRSDLFSAKKDEQEKDPGPVLRLLLEESFDVVHVLTDISEERGEVREREATPTQYLDWLVKLSKAKNSKFSGIQIERHDADENLAANYEGAYEFTRETIGSVIDQYRDQAADVRYGLLLTPGYSPCQVSMLLASEALFHGKVEVFESIFAGHGGPGAKSGIARVTLPISIGRDLIRGESRFREEAIRRVEKEINSQAFDDYLGESQAIKRVIDQAKVFAHEAANASGRTPSLLLTGEMGTGKTVLARCINAAIKTSESEGEHPFIEMNARGTPDDLVASEVLGIESGAASTVDFSIGRLEQANGGVLFIDEIGNASTNFQMTILKAIDDPTFFRVKGTQPVTRNFRLICATNADLDAMVAAGTFRGDLLSRIRRSTIELPPLHERGGDAALFAKHFVDALNGVAHKKVFRGEHDEPKSISVAALREIGKHAYRGNIRELETLIEDAYYHASETSEIGVGDLQFDTPANSEVGSLGDGRLSLLSESSLITELHHLLKEVVLRLAEPPEWLTDVLGQANAGKGVKKGKLNAVDEVVDALLYGLHRDLNTVHKRSPSDAPRAKKLRELLGKRIKELN